ncbi:MAG TPA: C25 family cysteine peptidase [Candidatus Thermoplasmatota archaeon]|nr:C25 family cysteine peptidase [Candidatus Thermoplasmatota archaeon]
MRTQGGIEILKKNLEKIILVTWIVCCLTFISASPQVISGANKAGDSTQTYKLSFTVTYSKNDFSFDKLQGYDVVQLKNGAFTDDVGNPMMPMKNVRVALPTNMKVTSVQVLDVQEQSLDGTYTIYPSQQPLPLNTNQNHFTEPNTEIYESSQPYPASFIQLNGQSDFAGQVMVDITLYPLHYVPVKQQLTLVTSLTFQINGVSGYSCGDYLPSHISSNEQTLYQQMVQNMVINPETVKLQKSPNPQPMGVEPGNYEYVIITPESWVSDFQPLADWKTQKGVPAAIVTTDWIYNDSGYSGSNIQKIQAFFQDAYETWGTIYVLLGGDTDVIPCHYASNSVGTVADDTYYADFDRDWICEVNVGRASVTGPGNGTGQIENFINKVITYETNPPLTDYATNAGFFGFNLDGSTRGEQCKQSINTTYIPADWNVTTVYDSQSGNHHDNALNALNVGQNLINHIDHGSNDFMGTGYVNHGWGLYSSDMDALTNGDKQGIIYTMACDTTYYDDSACIAEHYVRNNNGGGIAFIGNSRYGWFYSGSLTTLSCSFDVHFFKSLFEENLYHLGAAFSAHKDEALQDDPTDSYYQYIYTELTLLGDPELPVWTENPMSLTVSYPNQLMVGSSPFTCTVTSGGSPIDQALVCLWKGTEVYMTGITDSNGVAAFNVAATTPGTLSVTVTKQNYLPYQGSATVMNQQPNLIVGPVTGGLLGISTEITNTGNASATGVTWDITLNGGLILKGKTARGSLASLEVNGTQSIGATPIIGFGPVKITIKVNADGVSATTKTTNAFVFLIYIKMG